MKKQILAGILSATMVVGMGGVSVFAADDADDKTYNIGICQLVQHEALDAATQGFKDAIVEALGEDAVTFDEQNAQGDSNTCSTIITDFVSKNVDLILANFTVTDERAEEVDFALPYMKVALGVVSPDDALIKDVKDLEGKKLIVVKGTTAETYFTDNYPDIELVKFDEYQEAYDALLDGRGDAFSTDNTEVLAWAQQNEGFSVGIESLGDIDTIAPAVQKGNTDLLNAINDEIKSLADEQFFHKDFEETLKPVYGDNINPDDLVVEGGVVDSEEKAEDADAAATEDSDAASDDTKDAETTEEPEETEAADAE